MDPAQLEHGVRAIQDQLDVAPEFPPEVEQAAAQAARDPRLPADDRTDIPFVTIDPPGARDLDQALHIERLGGGHRVHYAIADVAAFVSPGDAVDLEANRRGETLYGAGSKVPLHPTVLSEDAASLLPGQPRPALLWTVDLAADGERIGANVSRAMVRSRAQLDYASVQAQVEDGTADPMWALVREVGERRKALERDRGGVSLPIPEQEIAVDGDGWRLDFRARLPVEEWNEQISLLTGMAAAELMVHAEVGILRTLPQPDPGAIERMQRTARALGIEWPTEQPYPDFIRSLDPQRPEHGAMLVECTALLRGAGYAAFAKEVPEQPEHAALATTYTHVTAPLRRLVDRYAGEVCVALCADRAVPEWVLTALPTLPQTMAESGRRAGQYESAVLSLAEAALLQQQVGERFRGTIVDVDRDDRSKGVIRLRHPAIEGRVAGDADLPLGEVVEVELTTADVDSRTIAFSYAP